MISYKKRLTNEWVKTHSQLNIKAMINMVEHQMMLIDYMV